MRFDRRGSFGVVALTQVVEHFQSFGFPEFGLDLGEEVGVGDFTATAVPEDRADEGEARDRLREPDVGEPAGSVGVDTFRPGFEIFDDLFAVSAFCASI